MKSIKGYDQGSNVFFENVKIDKEMSSSVGITNYLRGKQKLLNSTGQREGSLLEVGKNIKLKLILLATCPTLS